MEMPSIFSKTITNIEKAMNIRARRHELIISNISNADTPGYKAFDIEFTRAMRPEVRDKKIGLMRTQDTHLKHPYHMPEGIRPQMITLSKEVTLRGDGNTVDMEREMGSLSENNLMYQVSSQILYKKFQGLVGAIQGGKK